MITLITYPAMDNAFSLSPFCCKAALMLDYAGVAWTREDCQDPRRMPHGKLPAIRTSDGRIIGDSDMLRLHLEGLGTDFHPGLSEIEKAQSRALIRMAEEHLYFHVILDRWGRDDVWPVIRDMYFNVIPFPIRRVVANGLRRNLIRGLDVHGLGRFSEAERLDRAEQDLKAISDILWQGPFLMGSSVTLADFSVAPMLNALRQTPVETPLALRVAGDPILIDYIHRVDTAVKPAHDERLSA